MRSVIDDEEEKTDSELTLNATTLLGIFFGLVLVCGVFFGFGYSMGRRGTDASSATTPAATTPVDDTTTTPAAAHAPKPSAMESLQAAANNDSTDTVTESTDAANSQNQAAVPVVKQAALSPAPKPSAVTAAPPAAPQIKPVSLPISPSQPTASTASGIMVQIAAVTHQEDANVLVSALRQHGYSVSVHNEPQDKLLHVQVGPFASRDAAKAMRSRLLSDGYNAILKQ